MSQLIVQVDALAQRTGRSNSDLADEAIELAEVQWPA